ncbi:MAG: anaphase promoting complex subunit doc1, partial [Thelocarpon superellum]
MPRRARTLQSTGQAATAPAPSPSPVELTPSPPSAPSELEATDGNRLAPDAGALEGVARRQPLVDGVEREEEDEGDEEDEDGDGDDEGEDDEDEGEERPPPFDPTHLKEIGNLASWTVSTCKPGCGVEALRDESPELFWQSDGPQPHLLNIHFTRLVAITHIRLYLDFNLDESYTPTKLSFLAGTSHHDLQEFVELAFEQPKGWIDVDLSGVGGGRANENDVEDDEAALPVLRAHLVQMRIAENHQNGKDTHVRGLQIFARDETKREASRALSTAPAITQEMQQREWDNVIIYGDRVDAGDENGEGLDGWPGAH